MSYAKKNLRELEDSAAGHDLGEVQEARFPRLELGMDQTGLNYLVIRPGRREAFAHKHREAEEVYVVLSGSGRVNLDGDIVDLAPMDVLRVSAGVTRRFEADGEGLEVLVVGRHVEGDSEMVPGFWDD